MRDSESRLRKLMEGGKDRHDSNWGLEPEFENAVLLAADVERELQDGSLPLSARPANPLQLALLDSGASDHMIGRGLLTPAEQATIYKVEPKTYALAEGSYTLDEAVKLWPFV